MPKSPWWVWACLAGLALASLASLSFRWRAEAANKAVGVVMEGQALNELAAASGRDLGGLLRELKSSGLTGVALTEETVGDLVDRGEVSLVPNPPFVGLIKGGPGALARIAHGVARRGGLASSPGTPVLGTLQFGGDARSLRTTSVGLNPADARAVRDAGLLLIARHNNVMGAGPAYIQDILTESKEMGAVAYLPAGEQVLGQRELVEDTSTSLANLNLIYLTPEFVKLGGDAKLAAYIPERTIRLHSMQQAEVDKSSPEAVVDRYKLAFRERNVRWLLVRPITFGAQDPVRSTSQFLASLKSRLAHEGGVLRDPRPYREPGVPRILFLAIGILAVPLLVYTSWKFVRSNVVRWGFAVLFALFGLSAWDERLRPVCALAIGVAAPVLAYCLWMESDRERSVFLDVARISAISLVGGLAVAGLLNGLPYLIEVKQALGVKAILIAPLLLVGWLLANRVSSFKQIARQPMYWGPALTGLVLIAAIVFLVVRSGNDAPSAVSDTELKLRALLDQIFFTRPRTKEILIGHPALVLGLLLYREARKNGRLLGWATILLTVGAVGQSDIVDTMCHTHTPLDIGFARIAIGLVLGGIIGLLLWLPVRAWASRQEGT